MSSKDTKVYDADEVSASLGGIPLNKGTADGEFLRISMETDAFTDVVGTDGEVTRSKSNDRRATVEVILMQTSDTNDLLSALHVADLNAPGGVGIGSFLVRDRQGRAVFQADKAWISKEPDVVYDRGATARSWMLRVAHLRSFHGGN